MNSMMLRQRQSRVLDMDSKLCWKPVEIRNRWTVLCLLSAVRADALTDSFLCERIGTESVI